MSAQNQNLKNSDLLHQQFVQLSARYSEYILGANSQLIANSTNAFGKPVCQLMSTELSKLAGLALSGLRTNGIIDAKSLGGQLNTVEFLKNNKVATVLLITGNYEKPIQELAKGHAIVLNLAKTSELHHYLLLGQKMAEKLLCPVFILSGINTPNEKSTDLNTPLIKQFLGKPDDYISADNSLEKTIFGNKRRTLAEWQNIDLPVMSNTHKNEFYSTLATAAEQSYFQSFIENGIAQISHQYEKLTGFRFSAWRVTGNHKTKFGLVCPAQENDPNPLVVNISKSARKDFLLFENNLLYPFGASAFTEYKSLKSLSVFDSVMANQYYYKQIAMTEFGALALHSIQYSNQPCEDDLEKVARRQIEIKGNRSSIYLDLDFTKGSTPFSKHELYIKWLEREFEPITSNTLKTPIHGSDAKAQRLPDIVRELNDKGPNYAKINRFYQDTALFHDENENIAEPFQALPVSSAISNVFRTASQGDKSPKLDLTACTGCLDCIVDCPHAAMPSTLFSYNEMVKLAIQNARTNGTPTQAFTQVLASFIKDLTEATRQLGHKPKTDTLEPILLQAKSKLLASAKNEELAKTYEDEYQILFGDLEPLQVAFTDKHYWDAEGREEGSGLVFTLAINHQSCTQCGICAERCETNAIYLEASPIPSPSPHKKELNSSPPAGGKLKGRNPLALQNDLISQLPDTPGAKIQALVDDDDFDPFAALFLSRHFYESMVGKNEKGYDQQHTTLHSLFALTEEIMQSRWLNTIAKIDALVVKLTDLIKKQLSVGIPTNKLNSLTAVLNRSNSDFLSMDRILEEWGSVESFKLVKKNEFQRVLNLIQQLKELKSLMISGPTGMGRARFSMVLGKGLEFVSQYPFNAFKVPVTVANNNELELTQGLFEGYLNTVIGNIKLMRRAELVAKKKYKPDLHDEQIAHLNWSDLTDAEKQMVPPVFLFANQEVMDKNLDGFMELFHAEKPIKCFLFNSISPQENATYSALVANSYPLLLAASSGNNLVSRIYASNKRALYNSALKMIKSTNTTALEIGYAEIDEMEMNANRWPELYGLAMSCQAFIEYSYDPEHPGKSFGEKLNTNSNPDFNKPWTTTTLSYKDDESIKEQSYTLTWADWAFMHKPFKHHFEKVPVAATNMQLADYNGKGNAVLIRTDAEGKLNHYKVSDFIIKANRQVEANVQMMQELSGLYTKHPEKLKHLVEKELAVKYEQEQKAIKAEYEKAKQGWKDEHIGEVKAQIKQKLVELSQMAKSK